MDIRFKRENEIPYGDLSIGDIFTYSGHVYMVTDQPEEDTEGELKSVDLANGKMEIFGSEVITTFFDKATLTLE